MKTIFSFFSLILLLAVFQTGCSTPTDTPSSNTLTGTPSPSPIPVPVVFCEISKAAATFTGHDQLYCYWRIYFTECMNPGSLQFINADIDGNPLTFQFDYHGPDLSYWDINFNLLPGDPSLWRQFSADIVVEGQTHHIILEAKCYLECSGRHYVTCSQCTPNCTNKSCGNDGCGGSCGGCPAGYTCRPTVENPNITACVKTSPSSVCSDCLSSCQGLPGCCTGCGCICESTCNGCF